MISSTFDHFLTLEETLLHQENLDELSQDRSLETYEKFSPNNYYGMASILKRYAGLPNDYSLHAVVPHGPSLSLDFAWEAEIKAPVPAIFYHSRHVKSAYLENIRHYNIQKYLFPCASPFLYLVELLKEQPQPSREGTLFFPTHSTHHITAHMNYEQLAERLSNLDSEYQPITICMYWKDYLLGRAEPFQKKGMKVVSAGHMYDPQFLIRLYHLCSMHQYAAGNSLGSHLFYSVSAGCSYFLLDAVDYSYTVANNVPKTTIANIFSDEFGRCFSTPTTTIGKEQLDIVHYHLGHKFLKSPEELQRELLSLDPMAELMNNPHVFSEENAFHVDQKLSCVPSETAPIERQFLYAYFSKIWNGKGDVCEIGPFLGGTTRAIALGMLHNPRCQDDVKLYTYDRFRDYYDGDRLIEYLQPAFQQGLLDETLTPLLKNSSSFLEVFQAFHDGQDYAPLIVPLDQALPDEKEDLSKSINSFSPPPDTSFGAAFVDGCKSWYGTKYFMQKVCPLALEGSIFIFQDYGWYICFWLPVFLRCFKDYFNFITFAGGNTFVFQLIEPLDAETIDTLFPDTPEEFGELRFHQVFSELIITAQKSNQTYQLFAYNIQYGAALAYIGCLDQAKAHLSGLAAQTWIKPYRQLLRSALQSPTYRPHDQAIHLYSQQEADDILAWVDTFDGQGDELQAMQNRVEQLLQELASSQQAQAQVGHQLNSLQIQTGSLQKALNRKQKRLNKIKRRNRKTRKKLRQQLKHSQQQVHNLSQQLLELKSSRFFKLRNAWMNIRTRIFR